MVEFTLDTSGEIIGPHIAFHGDRYMIMPGSNDKLAVTRWPDLTPVEQGYVGALFASIHAGGFLRVYGGSMTLAAGDAVFFGFRHLASETIAAIRTDCAAWKAGLATEAEGWAGPMLGREFWIVRQKGRLPEFPPLAVTIDGEGKVQLRPLDQADKPAS
jgi:hypothetical protein